VIGKAWTLNEIVDPSTAQAKIAAVFLDIGLLLFVVRSSHLSRPPKTRLGLHLNGFASVSGRGKQRARPVTRGSIAAVSVSRRAVRHIQPLRPIEETE